MYRIDPIRASVFIKTEAADSMVKGVVGMRTPIDRLAILLMIVGAINWLTVGLFGFDFVAGIFGGVDALGSRIIYSIVGIAGIYSISLLFREAPAAE